MSKPKHTPGPWTSYINSNGDYLVEAEVNVGAAGGDYWQKGNIAHVFPTHGRTIENAQGANARLIAAAPELLEALEECRAEITRINRAAGETVFNPTATQLVDGALVKARGKK